MARSKSTQPELAGLEQAAGEGAPEVVLEAGLTYEDAVRQLEALVAQMESGQLPLEELLGAYRRSSALLAWSRERLQAVEDQIKLFESPEAAR